MMSFVVRRGEAYLAHLVIPKKLWSILGKNEFKKSLVISNFKEAELLATPLVLQWKKLIEEANHGMFSYFLMKGMEGEADANNDNQITAGELHAYVEQNAV